MKYILKPFLIFISIMFFYVWSCGLVKSDIITQYLRIQNSSGTTIGAAHTLKGATSCTSGVATFSNGGGVSYITTQGKDGKAVTGNAVVFPQGIATGGTSGTAEINIGMTVKNAGTTKSTTCNSTNYDTNLTVQMVNGVATISASGGGSTTNDYITVNHIKWLEQASTDLTSYPGSSAEVYTYLAKETHRLSYINYSKDIYTYTATFWRNLIPNLVPYIDATGNTSTDFLSATFTTVGSSDCVITVNTWECTSAANNKLIYSNPSTKGNKTIYFQIVNVPTGVNCDIVGIGRDTAANFTKGPACISIDGSANPNATVQLGYYNSSGVETAPTVVTISTSARYYFKIVISNYAVFDGSNHTADIAVWCNTTGTWGTANGTYSSKIPDSITWYDTIGGLNGYESSSIENYQAFNN